VLTNLPRLVGILDTVTRSITTDTGLGSLLRLKDLAQTLTALKPADVTFVTIPWKPRGDGANVLINMKQARPLLDAIANDTPYPPVPSTSTTGLKTPPSAIHATVLNASGVTGRARQAGAELSALGFLISSVATAPSTVGATVVHYGPSESEAARTLTAAIPGSTAVLDPSLSTTLVVDIGPDFTGVHAVSVPTATKVPTTADIRTAAETGCV
jgi:hypothetical protein